MASFAGCESSRSHTWERADQRKDRRKQYSGRCIQKQADADRQVYSQPCQHRLKEREGVRNVSFREVSHDGRDWNEFNCAILACTTELSMI